MIPTEWNQRYQNTTELPPPCQVLLEHRHLLPKQGTALDLACGLGANAILLAHHGLETYAWDYSEIAIQHLQKYISLQNLHLHPEVRDVVQHPPPPTTFDVIVVSRFLERNLVPQLVSALKPAGLLFYQTFTRTYVSDSGPKNPEYRLADNELLFLFKELHLISYREEGMTGDLHRGFRNEAWLIGKPINHAEIRPR